MACLSVNLEWRLWCEIERRVIRRGDFLFCFGGAGFHCVCRTTHQAEPTVTVFVDGVLQSASKGSSASRMSNLSS